MHPKATLWLDSFDLNDEQPKLLIAGLAQIRREGIDAATFTTEPIPLDLRSD